jgi:hypothetical protein
VPGSGGGPDRRAGGSDGTAPRSAGGITPTWNGPSRSRRQL